MVVSREVSVLEIVVLVVGLESQQVVSLLGILPLEFTTGMGGVIALRRRGGTVHGSSFIVLVLLQAARVGFLGVVSEVVFVVVVDAKSAPHAKHTGSRTSWLHTRRDHKTCQSIFPEINKRQSS
jgi:hypothetical protein